MLNEKLCVQAVSTGAVTGGMGRELFQDPTIGPLALTGR